MLNIRDNFFVRPDKVKQAADAGVSIIFKEVLPLLEQTPIDKNQQSLLDEVKMLAESLKNTVLDSSEESTGSKDNQETRQFIATAINRESDREKQKIKLAKDQDKKSVQILQIKQKNTSSTNENGKIKGSQTKIKVQLGKIDFISENDLKENPIAHAGYKKPHQPQGLKEHKNIGQEIESVENTPDPKPTPSQLTPGTSIAKLKNRNLEKVKIVEILQRQMVHSRGEKKSPGELEPDKIAQAATSFSQNLQAFAGQKNRIPKGNLSFEQQLFKRKAFLLTENQREDLKKLLAKTKAKRTNTQETSETGGVKLETILSGQLGQKATDEDAIGQSLNQKTGADKKTGLNKRAREERSFFNNQSRQTKKVAASAKTDAKSDQNSGDPLNKYDTDLFSGRDIRPGIDSFQNRGAGDNSKDNPEKHTGLGKQERFTNGVPEELQTAVHWMAQEEVENKLVEVLSRQARLRGVDLS